MQRRPAFRRAHRRAAVRAVTLSNGGLVQIERAGELAPDAAIDFRAPAEDVDDLLEEPGAARPRGAATSVPLPPYSPEWPAGGSGCPAGAPTCPSAAGQPIVDPLRPNTPRSVTALASLTSYPWIMRALAVRADNG